jgi:hypothetical protein
MRKRDKKNFEGTPPSLFIRISPFLLPLPLFVQKKKKNRIFSRKVRKKPLQRNQFRERRRSENETDREKSLRTNRNGRRRRGFQEGRERKERSGVPAPPLKKRRGEATHTNRG